MTLLFIAEYFDCCFSYGQAACWAFCIMFGVLHVWKEHWVSNNLLGMALAFLGVELLHINTVTNGYILFIGFFIYEVVWVFATDVMVTVAKEVGAPIKLVFPLDFLEKGFAGGHFATLGIGDIVIPGFLIALLLRFDFSLNRKGCRCFLSSLVAYVLAMTGAISMVIYFSHLQPALFYWLPACVGLPLMVAFVGGDVRAMFEYEDYPIAEEPQWTFVQMNKQPRRRRKYHQGMTARTKLIREKKLMRKEL